MQRCPFLKHRKRGEEVEIDEKVDLSLYDNKFHILKEIRLAEDSLLGGYVSYIISLIKLKSLRTADVYQTAYYSLSAFAGNIKLRSITPQLLNEYDVWMRDKGKSKSTMGIYIRTLRKIINNAIDNDILSKKQYPFGKNKYIIPSSRNIKKAIDRSILKSIYYY